MSGDDEARVSILGSIRANLEKSAKIATAHHHAPRASSRSTAETLDSLALVERFQKRLHDVGGTTAIARDLSHAASLVQEYLAANEARSLACSDGELVRELAAGLERTEQEYSGLFEAAGFKLTRIIPTCSPLSLIEGVPAAGE